MSNESVVREFLCELEKREKDSEADLHDAIAELLSENEELKFDLANRKQEIKDLQDSDLRTHEENKNLRRELAKLQMRRVPSVEERR